jgi:hypothetical protein
MAFTSINDSIINTHINNNSSCNLSIALKISGKGLRDTSNASNIYDNNGIGLQLWSNTSNNRELAIIDTSNATNSNYATLRLGITQSGATIRSITSNNIIRPLVINDFLTITSNRVGIGTTNPLNGLDVRGNITLDGNLLRSDGSLFTNSQWSNSTINSNNIYYNLGNIGIGTTNPIAALDIRNGNVILDNNSRIGIGLTNPQYAIDINNGNVNIGGNLLISLNNTTNNFNIYTASSNSITFSSNITADILLVGAGGNGGNGTFSGGGGAGEVIYYPNYLFTSGMYSFIVGRNSTNTSNRITRITSNNNDIITALGGGDGGGVLIITNNTTLTLTQTSIIKINYGSNISINAGTYNITFSYGAISITGLSNDYSYPILKDTNDITINPTMWYKFDNNILDSSGNNNDLILLGGVYSFSSTIYAKGSHSIISNDITLSLTSTNTYTIDNTTPNMSIAFWYNIFGLISIYDVLCYGETGYFYVQRYTTTNKMFIKFANVGLITINNYYSADNIWHHFAMTGEKIGTAVKLKIYIDGVFVQDNGISGDGTWLSYTDKFRLFNALAAKANVDDLRIYVGRVLTDAQISELYKGHVANLTPSNGGSGGGGYLNNTGANSGTKWNNTYSYVNNGNTGTLQKGGNGGSAISGGYTELLTGYSLNVGIGGIGIETIANIFPIAKKTYGTGGDGGSGIGGNGVIIIKPVITKTLSVSDTKLISLNVSNINNSIIQNTVYPYLSMSLYPLNYIHNNNYGYYIITSNTSIIFKKDTKVDLLVVGCGGNGGLGILSGGGGAGEIIYYPDYIFNYGTYDIQIGSNYSNPDLKNTKIYDNNTNYIIAKAGGDGVGNNTNPIISVSSGSVPVPINVSGSTTERYILFENSGSVTFRANTLASFVLIGGGGSGGGNNSTTSPGAGGGAGQYIYSNNLYIPAYNTINITIGSGGVNVANSITGTNGTSSYIIINNINYTAFGGGGATLSGASGGGNGGFASIFSVTGYNGGSNGAGAGGGGAGTNGFNYSDTTGGGGGSGINMNITGTVMQVSGGGSGGSIITTASTGAVFGGGQGGGSSGINGRDATSYGSGGGGAGYSTTSTVGSGGAGKSGVFIIRYTNINYNAEQYRSANCNIGSGGGSYINDTSITKGTNWDVKYSLLNNGNVGTITTGGSGGSALFSGGYREIITETNILVGIGGNGATSSSMPVIKTDYGNGGDGNGGLGKEGVVIIKFPIENITTYDGYYLSDDNYYVKANETGFIKNYNTNNIYYNRGFVGIGISTPMASLHVNSNIVLSGNISNTNQNGFVIESPTSIRFAINNDTTSNIEIFRGSTNFRRQNVSIIGNLTVSGNIEVNSGCNINITGGGFYQTNNVNIANPTTTFSDYRIKTNIIDINDNNALQQILAIKPKTFNYIDSNERGSNLVYGFIAQDVKEVIPQAVKIETQYVPNIYKSYDYINNEIIINEDLNDKLLLNDKILLRDDENYYKSAMITYISSNMIKVNIDIKGDHCFIYGKEISDFHTLDKTYIYTLNVCATQDLYKLIEQQQSNIDIIKTKIIDRQSNINQIYQLLQ